MILVKVAVFPPSPQVFSFLLPYVLRAACERKVERGNCTSHSCHVGFLGVLGQDALSHPTDWQTGPAMLRRKTCDPKNMELIYIMFNRVCDLLISMKANGGDINRHGFFFSLNLWVPNTCIQTSLGSAFISSRHFTIPNYAYKREQYRNMVRKFAVVSLQDELRWKLWWGNWWQWNSKLSNIISSPRRQDLNFQLPNS